jgi:hypothetical protein
MAGSSLGVWYAAGGDCEQVRSGLLGQPANAVSAAGYLVAGGWVLVCVCRRRAAPLRYRWFAAAVAANGVGSGLYHGPGWPGSGWCHDVAAIAVPVFIAADGLGGIRAWDDRTVTRVGLAATAAAAAGALARPVTNIAMLTAATAAVLAEAVVARRPSPRGRRPGRVVMVAALVIGVTAYLLGRTGGPLCRPDSLLQAHALWHLLTAGAMAAWAADRIAHPTRAGRGHRHAQRAAARRNTRHAAPR